jgi:hypothetical protein
MKKTTLYMLLAAAVLGMGGCGKADQPASADNGGTGAKTAEASIELSVFAGSIAENTPTGTGIPTFTPTMPPSVCLANSLA